VEIRDDDLAHSSQYRVKVGWSRKPLHSPTLTPTGRQARSDRDTATARLLSAYRDTNDARARERLVELYMPLVEGLARRHERRGAEHDDLVQAGSIGLLNAIERFDPKRGEEFVAFAVPTVAGEMKRHLRDRAATVRLPRSLHEASVRLPRAREALTARLGRAPSAAELAAEVRVSEEDLTRLESTIARADEEMAADPGSSELEASEARLLLSGAFRTLDDTDRTILYLRFVQERSMREVADQLGMSQNALGRRANAALSKLRAELEGRAFVPAPTPARVVHLEPAAEKSQPATPSSKARARHSGRLMLRMPQSLHAELAEAAEREEVSLNQYITNTLAAGVGWHTEGGAEPEVEPDRGAPPRWLPAAIVTNIVVVVIAGVIALILLVVALRQGL
jgi:RNA polymerase sigma-B factor